MDAAVPALGSQAALLQLALDRDVGTGLAFGMQGTVVAKQAILAEGGRHLSCGGPQHEGQQPARIRSQAGSEPHGQVET